MGKKKPKFNIWALITLVETIRNFNDVNIVIANIKTIF